MLQSEAFSKLILTHPKDGFHPNEVRISYAEGIFHTRGARISLRFVRGRSAERVFHCASSADEALSAISINCALVIRSSLGLGPSGGPTHPWASSWSMSFAALP